MSSSQPSPAPNHSTQGSRVGRYSLCLKHQGCAEERTMREGCSHLRKRTVLGPVCTGIMLGRLGHGKPCISPGHSHGALTKAQHPSPPRVIIPAPFSGIKRRKREKPKQGCIIISCKRRIKKLDSTADLHFKSGLRRAPLICILSRSVLSSCLEQTLSPGLSHKPCPQGCHTNAWEISGTTTALTIPTTQPTVWLGQEREGLTQIWARSLQVTSTLAHKPEQE